MIVRRVTSATATARTQDLAAAVLDIPRHHHDRSAFPIEPDDLASDHAWNDPRGGYYVREHRRQQSRM